MREIEQRTKNNNRLRVSQLAMLHCYFHLGFLHCSHAFHCDASKRLERYYERALLDAQAVCIHRYSLYNIHVS